MQFRTEMEFEYEHGEVVNLELECNVDGFAEDNIQMSGLTIYDLNNKCYVHQVDMTDEERSIVAKYAIEDAINQYQLYEFDRLAYGD